MYYNFESDMKLNIELLPWSLQAAVITALFCYAGTFVSLRSPIVLVILMPCVALHFALATVEEFLLLLLLLNLFRLCEKSFHGLY